MTLDELLNLPDADQKAYLNNQLAEGLTPDEIYEALGTTCREMNLVGFFYVSGSFLIKPTRGYARTKPSNLG